MTTDVATPPVGPGLGFHGRLFGLVAPIYARLWKPVVLGLLSGGDFDKEVQTILSLRRPHVDELMVDLGCGPGNMTTALAKLAPGGFIAGLDLAFPMLQAGQRSAREAGLSNVAFMQGDAQRLPIRRDSVSLVCFCGALHLLPKPEVALAEIAAILRPGGSLVGMTLVKGQWWGERLIERFFSRFLRFRFFAPAEVERMLTEAGLVTRGHTRARLLLMFHATKAE